MRVKPTKVSDQYYVNGDPAPPTPSGSYDGAAGGKSILKLLAQLGEDLVPPTGGSCLFRPPG